jgi:hypothetical protein
MTPRADAAPPPSRPTISTSRLARVLGVSIGTVLCWARFGAIPYTLSRRGRYRYVLADVLRSLNSTFDRAIAEPEHQPTDPEIITQEGARS